MIRITPQGDDFDDVRMEYAEMLKNQLAKGNNGLMRSKYITFAVEADSVREARPKLERIEADILNNFKVLGVSAYPLNGVERLQIMYETFNPDQTVQQVRAPYLLNWTAFIWNRRRRAICSIRSSLRAKTCETLLSDLMRTFKPII